MNKVGRKLPGHHQHSIKTDLDALLVSNGIDVKSPMPKEQVQGVLGNVLGMDLLDQVQQPELIFDGLVQHLRESHKMHPEWHIPLKLRNCQCEDALQPPTDFVTANITGKKKALIVGINYLGQKLELGGCINDAKNEYALLTGAFGFQQENILMLTEDQGDDSKLPTAAHIREGFNWLLEGAEAGDLLFFSYSGHGSQMKDHTGEEEDGMNECICPLDCMAAPWPQNIILDNELNDVFYDSMPAGVGCICVFDCCHSGSMGDLRHQSAGRSSTGAAGASGADPFGRGVDEEEKVPLLEKCGDFQMRYIAPPESRDVGPGVVEGNVAQPPKFRGAAPGGGLKKNTQVWCLSGCQDAQTSADATINGVRQGAFTWSIMAALKEKRYDISYDELLILSAENLKSRGFEQIPAVSTTQQENFRAPYLGSPDARCLAEGEPKLLGFSNISCFGWIPCIWRLFG